MAVALPDQALIGYAFAREERVLERLAQALHPASTAVHRYGGAFVLSALVPPDSSWNRLLAQARVLGDILIFTAGTAREIWARTADPRLAAELRGLVPPVAGLMPSAPGIAWRAGVAVWETTSSQDGEGSRRFAAAIARSAGPAAESLFWPAGGAGPAPLARYLLRAATGDADALRRERRALEGAAGGLSGLASGAGTLFAADAELAAPVPASRVSGDDPSRNVFVVYGRDEQARQAVFDFLRALGLNPLEWETILQRKGDAAPYLGEAVRAGLDAAAAVVVVMSPDDVVRLHPDLHEPGEKPGETADTLQPRPNVLIELGMALAAKNGKTVLLKAGDQRDITDLAGYSYVRLADTPECRIRIRQRLEAAGCRPAASTDWLTAGDFAALSALHRHP